jgi:hypothetical protein
LTIESKRSKHFVNEDFPSRKAANQKESRKVVQAQGLALSALGS